MTQAVLLLLFAEKLCIKSAAVNRKKNRAVQKGNERLKERENKGNIENPSRKQKIFHFVWHCF